MDAVTQPRRQWQQAREKVDHEGMCRVAAGGWGRNPCDESTVEAAHIIGREHDKNMPMFRFGRPTAPWRSYTVAPCRIVPLCRKHHRAYDAHELDLLGYLTPEEEAQAVLDAGSLESARRRLCPSEYRREAA